MQTKERRTSSYKKQRQRATAFFFFAAIHFKIMMFIMLEISPTEPGRDDVYGSGMGNTVMNVLYSGLMPA